MQYHDYNERKEKILASDLNIIKYYPHIIRFFFVFFFKCPINNNPNIKSKHKNIKFQLFFFSQTYMKLNKIAFI